jgi:hypothetical protein
MVAAAAACLGPPPTGHSDDSRSRIRSCRHQAVSRAGVCEAIGMEDLPGRGGRRSRAGRRSLTYPRSLLIGGRHTQSRIPGNATAIEPDHACAWSRHAPDAVRRDGSRGRHARHREGARLCRRRCRLGHRRVQPCLHGRSSCIRRACRSLRSPPRHAGRQCRISHSGAQKTLGLNPDPEIDIELNSIQHLNQR